MKTHRPASRPASRPARRSLAAPLGGALAALAMPLVAAAPAHAEPETPEHVFLVAADSTCYTSPDAHNGEKSDVRLVLGATYMATPATISGTGVGGGDDVFRWVKPTSGGPGCFVSATSTSSDTGNLHARELNATAVVHVDSESTAIGGVLARNARNLYAAPSFESTLLGEVEEGDVLTVSGRIVQGQTTLVGQQRFMQVAHAGGSQSAWILAHSLLVVPEIDPVSLTNDITLEHDVTSWEAPSDQGEPVAFLKVGDDVQAGEPWHGFLPISATDSETGVAWISQAEMAGAPDPTETPSAEPSPSESESPGVIDKIKEGLEEKAEQAKDKAAQVAAEKAKTIDAARLRIAGLIAALAAGMALLGHTLTSRMRRGIRSIAVDLAAGGPVGLAKHLTIPAGAVGAVVAAALAPTANFLAYTLAGAAVLGLLVGGATAARVANYADRSLVDLGGQRWQWIGAGALAAIPALHYGLSLGWPVAIVVSLIGAGAGAGVLGPKGSAPAEPEAQPEPEPVEVP